MNCEESWWHLLVSGLTLRSKTFSKVRYGSRHTTRLGSMNFALLFANVVINSNYIEGLFKPILCPYRVST
jgi:hypothetical protein